MCSLAVCLAVLDGGHAPLAFAGVDAEAACTDAKAKAAGKQASALLKARGKFFKSSDQAKLDASVSKAGSKLTKAFVKADAKGGCLEENDVDSIATGVEAFVADMNRDLNPLPVFNESDAGTGTATTDQENGGDGATPDDNLETTVIDPGGGSITINETTVAVTPPDGFTLIDTQSDISITGPTPTAADPYQLIFRLDSSLEQSIILTALELLDVQVFQYNPSFPEFPDGRLIVPCTGDGATPDPCVQRSFDAATNDVVLTVYTTTASIWAFGTPKGKPDDCCTAQSPQSVTFTFTGTGPCGILRNFRCSNDSNAACVTDADCMGGTCNEVVALNLPEDLNCGSLYTGGGLNSVPLPIELPGIPTSVTDVTSCNALSGELSLGAKTAAETGSARTCTSGRACSGSGTPCALDSDCPSAQTCDRPCLFGAPIPIPGTVAPTSVCAVIDVETDASGTATCNGDIDLSLPVRMDLFLNGDLLGLPGVQPCPVCVGQCIGGSGPGSPCADDMDCFGGVCGGSPVCMGGPNDTMPCTPESIPLGSSYRTSHDCPSAPFNLITGGIGGVPLDLALTTSQQMRNAFDLNTNTGGSRVFCGFCRDSDGAGSLCFEGDTSGCPPATPPASGVAVPCTTDADCQVDTDEYESCAQRTSGAFSEAAATHIRLTGRPAPPSLGGDSRLVSTFCVPPTFDATVDAAADLPGPGAIMLQGEVSISP